MLQFHYAINKNLNYIIFQLPINTSEPHYSTPVRHRRNLSIGTTNIANNINTNSALNTMNRTMDERTTASLLADDLAVSLCLPVQM